MGSINLKHTGSGSAIALSSDGTSLLLNGTAIGGGGGGGGADLYDANESSPSAQPSATGSNAIAIGDSAVASGTRSTALGYLAKATASGSVALGMGRSLGGASFSAVIDDEFSGGATSSGSIAMGNRAQASSTYALAMQRNSVSNAVYSIAIGYNSNVQHASSIALGHSVSSTAANQVNIGSDAQDVRISETYTLPKVDGSANQVLTTDGSGAVSWAAAGGGGGSSDYVHISTQTVTSATAQVEFDLSNSDYGSYYIVAHDCAFTAAPSNEYCLYFNFYDGAYNSGSPFTNLMSLNYQRGTESGSTVSSSMSWAYNLTMRSGSTPTTSTKFGFSGMIGGRTNSPVDLNGYFITGTSAAGAPRLRGIAPNTSNDMTYMLIKPSSSTFASGKFALYGLKDA